MWSDRETHLDYLGYESYVEVLAGICTEKELTPLTLGVFGAWGSGKTSLMSMLKQRIDKDAESSSGQVRTLWFNAWRYEGREEAQSALIHAVLAKISEGKTLAQDAKETFARLKKNASVLKLAKCIAKTAITLTPDLDGFLSAFEGQSESIAQTMESFDKDFLDALRLMDIQKIVVLIDDLDRCSSAKVIETFETIKLFLNTPSCAFVIGADAKRIEEAVGDVYSVSDQQRRKDYLEKIVQIPFLIPEQQPDDLVCYVGMLLIGRYLDGNGASELSKARPHFLKGEVEASLLRWPEDNRALFGERGIVVLQEELREVLPCVRNIARALRGNPRQIKRFLNALGLRRRLAIANNLKVAPNVLIKLTVLEYVWEGFFAALAETVDPRTGESVLLAEISEASSKELEVKDSQLLADALSQPGLIEYLNLEPILGGGLDLRPYLFLAQTSLNREASTPILPVEELARSLARGVGSDDRLRSKAAAHRAATQESAIVSAVVKIIAQDLPGAKDGKIRTHLLRGLDTICSSHKEQYPAVLKALGLIVGETNDAVALVAKTLIGNARSAGVDVPSELDSGFKSKLADALAPKSRARGGKVN